MKYAELVSLYFERSDALQSYWTLYVVVIGGLLAIAALRPEPDLLACALVSVLYCGFAYKNLGAIQDVTVNRLATLDAIRQFDASALPAPESNGLAAIRRAIEPSLTPPAYPGVRNFHVGCDILALATLWALQYRRWRRSQRTPAAG